MSKKAGELKPVEVREYEGEKLSLVNDLEKTP
jgi:hypothetical protein